MLYPQLTIGSDLDVGKFPAHVCTWTKATIESLFGSIRVGESPAHVRMNTTAHPLSFAHSITTALTVIPFMITMVITHAHH